MGTGAYGLSLCLKKCLADRRLIKADFFNFRCIETKPFAFRSIDFSPFFTSKLHLKPQMAELVYRQQVFDNEIVR